MFSAIAGVLLITFAVLFVVWAVGRTAVRANSSPSACEIQDFSAARRSATRNCCPSRSMVITTSSPG